MAGKEKRRYINYRAPWVLCAGEVLTVLLIYFLAFGSKSLVMPHHRFSFTHSLDDVVGIVCARSTVLSMAYAIGQRALHKPYLYATYLLAGGCLPYLLVKMILFRYGSDGVAAAAIMGIAATCSLCHVLAARSTVEWARRRYQMGLAGFGMPWEEGEDAWVIMRRPDLEEMTKTSDGGGPDSGEDVPAEMLADDDSKFVELTPGLKIHYKEVTPQAVVSAASVATPGGPDAASTGIVLVHGFGGGVFAWRHVMEALAMQCHCRVIAFDRPAFGLTSRPKATEQSNPYTVASQSQLLLQLCSALGLRHVVLVAHADACLVTLRAAAASASHYQQRWLYAHPPFISAPPYGPLKAPEHARTAPPSAEASPKYACGSPASPVAELAPAPSLVQQQQSCAAGGSAQASAAPIGGALSAAAFAAAAAGGDVSMTSQGLSQQLGGGAAAPSQEWDEWELGRGVVSADEAVGAGSSSSYHGAGPGSAAKAQLDGNAPYAAALGAAYHAHRASALPTSVAGMDVEAGMARCDILEMDRASSTSTSISTNILGAAHHRRAQSVPGPVGAGHCCSARSSDAWEVGSCGSSHPPVPYVLGLVMLHPNLSGSIGPAFSRILARSPLGRSILRPLLRTEVGEVANRRAWHNTDKLTSEVMELYKTPLRVEGWDAALIETTRQRPEACQGDLQSYCTNVQTIPTLIATGEHDRIVPPNKSETLGADLPHARLSVLHDCGHLSHEEAPSALLAQLVPFCGEVLGQMPVVGIHPGCRF
ncbi:hypothetical protein GPECTOR_3g400 [Gonium pectorale]|uniref:AB hydrolase-1 domain-containing protein n=1 Tax=Gonium pectorale TaxID=33097 RepID=A0A150GZT7_GONPE|nr:hypothetical protein GPECTOR_3g400 [Gonium pectorale]|eukprot:KXZ55263.1 hypothetical protein GPECTOR_3g400 [Gonium pectorale]